MFWLLWREYRLNRLILVTGGVLVLLPMVVATVFKYDRTTDFYPAWAASTLFGYLTVAMLAGNAIAGERADRSAEFVAYLPLARWHRLASKLILFLITFIAIWAVTFWGANQLTLPAETAHIVDLRVFVINVLVTYSIGWLFTSFLSSPTYASVVAGSSLVVVLLALALVAHILGLPMHQIDNSDAHETLIQWYAMIGLPLAIVCFSMGTWNYLRRADP